MQDLPEDLAVALKKAGWVKDNKTRNIESLVAELEKDGYTVSESVKDFLREFGGLCIKRTPDFGVDWFDFNPAHALGGIYPEQASHLSETFGVYFCPIGEADCGNTTLLIDDTKRIFATWGDEVFLLGSDPLSAIDNLYYAKDRPHFSSTKE